MFAQRCLMRGFWFGVLISLCAPLYADDSESFWAEDCQKAGGEVVEMAATFDTSSGRVTGYQSSFCQFYADGGIVVIGLETFSSYKPSIAATFIKELGEISDSSSLWTGTEKNPSHNVCRNLNGTMIGFVSSGGFSNARGQSDICVFGDGSMVSAWSLIYMANHRAGYDAIKEQVKASPLNIPIPSSTRS